MLTAAVSIFFTLNRSVMFKKVQPIEIKKNLKTGLNIAEF